MKILIPIIVLLLFFVSIPLALADEWVDIIDDTRVTFNSAESGYTSIGIDGAGNIHIAWQNYRDGDEEIYYTKLDGNDGSTLVDDTRLTFDGAYSVLPSIGIDSAGNVHIAWEDNRDGNYEIYYTKGATESAANAPVITYSQEINYLTDGVDPNKGTAESTELTFKTIYTDDDNDAPEYINIVINDGATTITSPLILDTEASAELQDNDFTNGEQYTITFTFPKGKYNYYFESSDGTDTVRLPETGTLSFETGYSNVAFLPG